MPAISPVRDLKRREESISSRLLMPISYTIIKEEGTNTVSSSFKFTDMDPRFYKWEPASFKQLDFRITFRESPREAVQRSSRAQPRR